MDTETAVYRNYSGYLSFGIPQLTPIAGNEERANMISGGQVPKLQCLCCTEHIGPADSVLLCFLV